MTAYVAGLSVAVAIALVRGNMVMRRVAVAVVGNWVVNTAFVFATDIYDPWYWFFLTDLIAAWVVLRKPACRIQALIGLSYLLQLTIHVAYFIVDNRMIAYTYWQMLTAVGWTQLLFLGAWGAGGAGKIFRWRRGAGHHRVAHSHDRGGLA